MNRADSSSRIIKTEDNISTKTPKSNEIFANIDIFREDLRKQITNKIKSNSKLIENSSATSSEGLSALISSRRNERITPGTRELGTSGFKLNNLSHLSTTPGENSRKKTDFNADTLFAKRSLNDDSPINGFNTGNSKNTSCISEIKDLLSKNREPSRTSFNGKYSTISKSNRSKDLFTTKLNNSNQGSPLRK